VVKKPPEVGAPPDYGRGGGPDGASPSAFSPS